jgi:hypothetical protein
VDQVPWDVLIGPYGLLGFLLFVVVWGGRRRWWVFGWVYEDLRAEYEGLKAENDRLRELGMRAAQSAETGIDAVERLAQDRVARLEQEIKLLRREIAGGSR